MRAEAEANGRTLDVYAVYSYAGVQALAAALTHARDPLQASQFLKTHAVPTVLGNIRFDTAGDIVNPTFEVYTFRSGKIVLARK